MDGLLADENSFSLADEKLDFDITLSPASSIGEEEQEELVCPGGWKVPPLSSEEPPWSTMLTESICQEALSLASRLEEWKEEVGGGGGGGGGGGSSPPPSPPPPVEQFVQDPWDKLGLLSGARPSTALSPIKRETFCVRDSPLKLLPPALQTRLLAPPATGTRSRLSTASPAGPKTRSRTRLSLRGNTGLGVLPNKPAPPPSTLSGPKRSGPADRPGRCAPPGKGALGLQRGSSRRGSCEDLLSDTPSVASDASDCSLDSSTQGGRSRATNPGRAPPTSTRKGVEPKRHALPHSLSSGLSASLTGKASSSLASPGGPRTRRSVVLGKAAEPPAVPAPTKAGAGRSLSTTLRRSFGAGGGAKPTSVGGRSTSVKRAEPGTPLALTPAKRLIEKTSSRTSLAPSSSRTSLAPSSSRTNLAPSSSRTSLAPSSSRTSLAPPSSSRTSLAPPSSSKTSLAPPSSSRTSLAPSSSRTSLAPSSSRTSLAPSKPRLSLASSKPSLASSNPQQQPGSRPPVAAVAPMAPTPTQLRRLAGPEGVMTPDAQLKNPKRLRTTCSLDSFPQRAEPPSTPTSTCGAGLQGWARCSALPTPSGRRLSCIPTRTPRSLVRPARPGPPSWSPPRWSPPGAPEQEQQLEQEEQQQQKEEEEEEEEEEQQQEEEEELQQQQQEEEEEQEEQQQEQEQQQEEKQQKQQRELMEFPLVDVPAPLRYREEKLLIDLSNSPDVVRTPDLSAQPCGRELIDLSSPLIKWSPEQQQSGTGVLINISF